MCKVLQVPPAGSMPVSRHHVRRAKDDQRILGMIKQSWLESGAVYGYRKITCDLRVFGRGMRKAPRGTPHAQRGHTLQNRLWSSPG
jgi:putative transposase